MTGLLRNAPLVAALICLPSTAYPQLGEVQLGSIVSYGPAAPYGIGAGLVLGVAAGRLAYVGLRWTYQTGSTEPATPPTTSVDVRNRVQVFGADLGLLFPAGALEVVPGGTLGVARFAQRAGVPGAGFTTSDHAMEFFGAPSLSVQAHVAGLVLIPEIQYQWAGSPDLPWPVSHRGPVASLRVVVPFEVDRIRY
ncbi:MAG: hypothetical protein HYW06_05800 [Gemmatimonadetes bacterium]|nr:hypothetical protein [Gemmatimonadota bacterium]MBI2536469.1 hypothetical protein [Gemmatimonadota bacterium]